MRPETASAVSLEEDPDRPRHTYADVARLLGIGERRLRRDASKLPRTKAGQEVRFSDNDVRRIWRIYHREPASGSLAAVPSEPATSGAAQRQDPATTRLRPLSRRRRA
ncbi:MAG TPA: DNA-binding protein [Streptomyces sp.]|nr:DNA-binding protein [Streptomyces sp.]